MGEEWESSHPSWCLCVRLRHGAALLELGPVFGSASCLERLLTGTDPGSNAAVAPAGTTTTTRTTTREESVTGGIATTAAATAAASAAGGGRSGGAAGRQTRPRRGSCS